MSYDLSALDATINRSLPFVRFEHYADSAKVSLCLQWFDREVVKTFPVQELLGKEQAVKVVMMALPKMFVALGDEMQRRSYK